MNTREKIKNEIDQLSETDLEKVYLYLSSLKSSKKNKTAIRSLKLKGKLDGENLRALAYE